MTKIIHLCTQGNSKDDTIDEREKRKREVEEKLQILNEKKHNLVQALKQVDLIYAFCVWDFPYSCL